MDIRNSYFFQVTVGILLEAGALVDSPSANSEDVRIEPSDKVA